MLKKIENIVYDKYLSYNKIITNYIDIIPLDITLLILKYLDIQNFIMIANIFDINLNNQISYIMKNYSYDEITDLKYLKHKSKNPDPKIFNMYDNIIDTIKRKIGEIRTEGDGKSNLYGLNKDENFIKHTRDSLCEYYGINIYSNINLNLLLNTLYNENPNENNNNNMNIYWMFYRDNYNDSINRDIFDNQCFQNLTYINFNENFNKKIDGKLPKTLTHLTFNYNSIFNKSIDKLPKNLKYLMLGRYFNQNVDNLPPSLNYLEFRHNFNQKIDNLPKYLETLILGQNFNTQITTLPPYLKNLMFDLNYNQPIFLREKNINIVPPTVTNLRFGNMFNQPICGLSSNIKMLTFNQDSRFNQNVDDLTLGLTDLSFGKMFNRTIDKLPNTVTKLTFLECSTFNRPIKNLPNNLKILEFGKKTVFNHSIDYLPPSLEKLDMGLASKFNHDINLKHLTNLKFLSLIGHFNGYIHSLPKNLEYLFLGSSFDRNIPMPDSLISLAFDYGCFYKSSITISPNLKYIALSKNYIFLGNLQSILKSYPHITLTVY